MRISRQLNRANDEYLAFLRSTGQLGGTAAQV
jgi:hypothetical protein